MKLRLNGNAIRLRLSKTDVEDLAVKGYLEEYLHFTKELVFSYRLEAKENIEKPAVEYTTNTITVYIGKDFTTAWPSNNVIGSSAIQTTEAGTEIFILIEKDFKCLDDTMEDQSDNFVNPKLK